MDTDDLDGMDDIDMDNLVLEADDFASGDSEEEF